MKVNITENNITNSVCMERCNLGQNAKASTFDTEAKNAVVKLMIWSLDSGKESMNAMFVGMLTQQKHRNKKKERNLHLKKYSMQYLERWALRKAGVELGNSCLWKTCDDREGHKNYDRDCSRLRPDHKE